MTLTLGEQYDPEYDDSLIKRIGNNSKLWAVLFILIVVSGIALIVFATSTKPGNRMSTWKDAPIGVYTDDAHRKYASQIVRIAKSRGIKASAVFLTDDLFKLTLQRDISRDEIAFLSNAAAAGIRNRFKIKARVETYIESRNSQEPDLYARTVWSDKAGGSVVQFIRDEVLK